MTHLAGPSTKTIAYRLLAALDAAPDGMLTDAQLMPMLALVSRTADKLAVQINILATSGLVRRTPDALQILPRGKQYMQQNYSEKVYQALPEPKSVYVGVIAAAYRSCFQAAGHDPDDARQAAARRHGRLPIYAVDDGRYPCGNEGAKMNATNGAGWCVQSYLPGIGWVNGLVVHAIKEQADQQLAQMLKGVVEHRVYEVLA